jgi:hypothetical protein
LQQDTPRSALFLLGLIVALACASAPTELERREQLAAQANTLAAALGAQDLAPLEPGTVRVRLAFPQSADLDLYVTGPTHETVYFANTPARTGGELERDLRCDAPAPRVEVVTFAAATAGPYRVGVDFPEHCEGAGDPVSFVVYLETATGRDERRRSIAPGHFLPIVMAAELQP